jgi:hypothetical protein
MFSKFIRLVFKHLKFLHIDKGFPQPRENGYHATSAAIRSQNQLGCVVGALGTRTQIGVFIGAWCGLEQAVAEAAAFGASGEPRAREEKDSSLRAAGMDSLVGSG